MKKLTIEEVTSRLEQKGFELLSKEYLGCKKKVEVRCSAGHVYSAVFSSLDQGAACPKCNPKTAPYEKIKAFVEEQGYKLLSKEYSGYKRKIRVECSVGHKYEVTWGNFYQGTRCQKCHREGLRESRGILNLSRISEKVVAAGFKLHTTEYPNAKQLLDIECSKGHRYKRTWGSFSFENGCIECSRKSATLAIVKAYVEEIGYTLHSEAYINNRKKLDVECDQGHRYGVPWFSLVSGNRCAICSGNKLNVEIVRERLAAEGHTLLSNQYFNQNTELAIRCPKGHEYYSSWLRFRRINDKSRVCTTCKQTSRRRKPKQTKTELRKLTLRELLGAGILVETL